MACRNRCRIQLQPKPAPLDDNVSPERALIEIAALSPPHLRASTCPVGNAATNNSFISGSMTSPAGSATSVRTRAARSVHFAGVRRVHRHHVRRDLLRGGGALGAELVQLRGRAATDTAVIGPSIRPYLVQTVEQAAAVQ